MQHIQSALEVRLKDTTAATLQAVLRFCYTAECQLTPDNVLPICALSEHFEVKALHSACVQFIEHNISVSSCCTMLEMAAQYHMEALRKVGAAHLIRLFYILCTALPVSSVNGVLWFGMRA